ncbi:MAG TPA: hypothetical protein VKU38_12215 [Ktedonobacteraceae bacterium]|nr:hypothetical protein [Ktedonobacteraceae bacterium]
MRRNGEEHASRSAGMFLTIPTHQSTHPMRNVKVIRKRYFAQNRWLQMCM